MAKTHQHSSSKVRIFFGFAEVEGGDHVIQDSVRSVAAAVVRAVNQSGESQKRSSAALGHNSKNALEEKAQESEALGEGAIDELAFDEVGPIATEVKRREPRAASKGVSYEFVKDLNLRPVEKESLKDFFEKKVPGDQQEQVAVFLYYLCRILNLTNITANHLHNCFHEVKKRTPADILQSVRNSQKRKGWVDGSDGKNLKITTKGANYVEHDLPNTPSVGG